MIEVENLTKKYGRNLALDHISFRVEEGTVLGFLGPNGAGKSTTMNIITGYLSPTEGRVSVGGCDTLEDPDGAKKQIGYLPEIPPLYMDMTVKEYLRFLYELKRVKLPREEHIAEICGMARLEEVTGRLIANLSKGFRQRVGIAQALLGNPPVLILDEPTAGLDPSQIMETRTLIQNLGKEHTVILSSHILPEVQAVCGRILIIHQGRIVADGAPEELAGSLASQNRIIVKIEGDESDLAEAIRKIPGAESVSTLGEQEPGVFGFSITGGKSADLRRGAYRMAAAKGWDLLELKSARPSLEELFLRLTSGVYEEETGEEAAV